MIATFLVENSALVPVVFLLIALVCVVVGHLLLRARRGLRILRVLVVLSVLPVVALTLVPVASAVNHVTCTVQFSVPTWGGVETLANVALFFPPVFFAALATRRPLLVLAAGTALSAAIEALQAVVPAIGRACDTNDWLMNTIGTILAALLAGATIAFTNRTPAGKATEPPRGE